MSISTLSLPSHAAYHMAIPTQSGMTTTQLTQILLTHNPHLFSLATTAPFLHSAGLGTLPKPTLSKWLSQDRLYAQSYIPFIGALIARVHLPHAFVADKGSSLRWRIVKVLTTALQNIQRKLDFFEDVARKYGLELEASPSGYGGSGGVFHASNATRQYESLFRAFGNDTSMTLLEGLVVLWATEQVDLSAWRYAATQGRFSGGRYWGMTSANGNLPRGNSQSPPPTHGLPKYNGGSVVGSEDGGNGFPDEKRQLQQLEADQSSTTLAATPRSPPQSPRPDPFMNDLDGGALRREFIPNWTSPEFERFVQEVADVTDELAEREEAWRKLEVYKAVWEHILEVERRFWPDIGVSF